uniref:Uncharacterized protein n=1 Tax=Arundo donax TaxID=35708 RepID=A0A0A8YEV8_ARUDO
MLQMLAGEPVADGLL